MLGAYLEGNQPHLEGHLLQIRSLDVSFKTDKQRLFLWQVVRSYFCQPPGLGWNLKFSGLSTYMSPFHDLTFCLILSAI